MSRRRALITGATGFIGGRLAECLTLSGWADGVTLVRDWSRAARLARLPVTMVEADLLDPAAVRRAVDGCDVVFHCAVDNRADAKLHERTSAEGTANVIDAALDAGVRRVIHLSSIAVYGYQPGHDAETEDGKLVSRGDAYCMGKVAAEAEVHRFHAEKNAPVVILRPTIVYGPYAGWTRAIVRSIADGRMALIDGGSHVCNAVYVDNVIDAMLAAADADGVEGRAFHVSDAQPVTWREFVEAHAEAIGSAALPSTDLTEEDAWRALRAQRPPSSLQELKAVLRDPAFRDMAWRIPILRKLRDAAKVCARRMRDMPTGVDPDEESFIGPASEVSQKRDPRFGRLDVEIFTTDVAFSISRAREAFGYAPRIDLAEGVRRTGAWLMWAGEALPGD